ncbi:MAG: hypothetical protein AAF497_16945, partial [Planctomycetota bacterium]
MAVSLPVLADPLKPDTWGVVDNDCQLKLTESIAYPATSERPARTYFKARTSHGTYAYAARLIAPTPIIAETSVRVPFRSSVGGQQVLVRVVFPRTVNEERANPLTTLVAGSTYRQPGAWRELTLRDLPKTLERHVRVLRSRHPGTLIDPREAYIDLVLVNVYAGTGSVDAWLGMPEISGAVTMTGDRQPTISPVSYTTTSPADQRPIRIELSANNLLIDGRAFFPRVVDDRGEDWAYLKSLGFNTIRVAIPPTADMIQRAEELGLWMVAPPPSHWRRGDMASLYRRVIAWDAGQSLSRNDLPATVELVRRIRNSDLKVMRPFICSADERVAEFGRQSNIQLHTRKPIGSTLGLDSYAEWLRDRVTLAGPSTMSWATIQTEPLSATLQQLASLGIDERTAT